MVVAAAVKWAGPSGVRTLSRSMLPLRLYCECRMRRMLRVALGLPLSCSVLGSSVAVSFFFPLVREEGSLLGGGVRGGVRTEGFFRITRRM